MKTLILAIQDHAGPQAAALLKHTQAAGILSWADCTRTKLSDFRDYLNDTVAMSSVHTYLAVFKSILGRYEEEVDIPCKNFRDVLKAKNDHPVKAYLTMEELERLERVETKSDKERFVLACFIVSAYTGMRISDTLRVEPENILNGYLNYVSVKTKIHATVPCRERIPAYIKEIRTSKVRISEAGYNKAIRRLCKRAGISERVKVRRGGIDAVKEKWECVSSHTARISFCSNLSALEVPLLEVKQMAGHSTTAMTERYIANGAIKISDKALAFFQ